MSSVTFIPDEHCNEKEIKYIKEHFPQICTMNIQKVAIIGAGALGRIILDAFDAVNAIEPAYDVLGFIVDPEYGKPGTVINERPILGGYDWLASRQNEVTVICAVGEPKHRLRLVERARDAGVKFCSIVHPGAMISRWATICEGTYIGPGCVVLSQAYIGNHIVVGPNCVVAEDAIVNDYTLLTVGIRIAGESIIGEGCYLGTGANVIDRIRVGDWSIVGAGATVVREVPVNTTVAGNPARVIQKREEKWQWEK